MNIRNEKEILKERLELLIEQKKDLNYKLSETKQAELIDIPYQTFHKYVKGTAECSISNLAKIANYYEVSTDYLLGLSDNPSVEPDIQNACNITGLSKKSIDKLKLMKKSSATTYQNGVVKKICPQTVIVDKLLSSTAFWQFTYQLSWLLNEKRNFLKTKEYIEETIKKIIDENSRLNVNYVEDNDHEVANLKVTLGEETDWFNFKKWEFTKRIESLSEEILDDALSFYFEQYLTNLTKKEDSENAEHNPTKE